MSQLFMHLCRRFWQLSPAQRLEVLQRLGVIPASRMTTLPQTLEVVALTTLKTADRLSDLHAQIEETKHA